MAKRTKALTRELHARGLRKNLARKVARQLADPAVGAAAPAERVAIAEELRSLADQIQGDAVAEHAEPHASAREAAGGGAGGNGDAPVPAHRRARPRARRN